MKRIHVVVMAVALGCGLWGCNTNGGIVGLTPVTPTPSPLPSSTPTPSPSPSPTSHARYGHL